jgi:hypothetical protein
MHSSHARANTALVLAFGAILFGLGCKKDLTPLPAPAQEMPRTKEENAVPRTKEENAAIECAKGFAKGQNLYKDGSTITAEQKNGLWVVTFVQPGLAPTSRGGSYEVYIRMPICELVRLLVLQ